MSLFNNPKPVKLVIGAFIIVVLIFFAYDGRAETAVEGGVPFISDNIKLETFNIMLSERNERWRGGIGLIGDMTYKSRNVQNNMLVFGERIVRGPGFLDNVILGIGLGYFNNTSHATSSHLNYGLSIEYSIPNTRFYGIFRHYSNAGTSRPNAGVNMINGGYRF